ncbi:MAG: hypothetical protein AB1742_15740, partial [bacterium]
SDHAKINMRETPWSAVCKHRLVSRAPRGSEGGDDSPQSKAAEATIHRDEECAKVHPLIRQMKKEADHQETI